MEREKLKKATLLLQKVKEVLEDKDKMAKICEYKKELISHCMVVKNIRQRLQHLLDYVATLKMQDDGKSVCIENKYFDEINDLKKFISDHGRESYEIVKQGFPEFKITRVYEDLNSVHLVSHLPDIGTPTNRGMAMEHCANPQALAKFLALTFS